MLRRCLLPASILVAIWWMLTGTLTGGRVAGALAVAVGLGLFLYLGGGGRSGIRPLPLVAFLPYFVWQSVRGGWDVSRRALTLEMLLNPTVLRHDLSLPPGPARVFLTNALSLMPGTLGADLRDGALVVHLLVGGPGTETRIRELERRVERLFGPAVR